MLLYETGVYRKKHMSLKKFHLKYEQYQGYRPNMIIYNGKYYVHHPTSHDYHILGEETTVENSLFQENLRYGGYGGIYIVDIFELDRVEECKCSILEKKKLHYSKKDLFIQFKQQKEYNHLLFKKVNELVRTVNDLTKDIERLKLAQKEEKEERIEIK